MVYCSLKMYKIETKSHSGKKQRERVKPKGTSCRRLSCSRWNFSFAWRHFRSLKKPSAFVESFTCISPRTPLRMRPSASCIPISRWTPAQNLRSGVKWQNLNTLTIELNVRTLRSIGIHIIVILSTIWFVCSTQPSAVRYFAVSS